MRRRLCRRPASDCFARRAFTSVGAVRRELLADPHASVSLDPETGVVRFVRTAVPYPGAGELPALPERIGKILARRHGRR